MTPFALRRADRFRPEPPHMHPDAGYREPAEEIRALSAALGDPEKVIAEY